jgi:glycosyltransferase involved in cell wall biosynthesis
VDGPRVVAVVPAYNEARTIQAVVEAALPFAAVLVVDDCSGDGTGTLAEAAGAMVVRNPHNLGYEGTLSRGFEVALERGFEYIISLDADGEHDPRLLAQFCRAMVDEGIPLVLGARPQKPRLAELIMGLYVRARFGPHDIACGMKGYRADLVRINGGFDTSKAVGTELALNSIRRGYRFVEISVGGTRRRDAPRLDGRWRANVRILKVLWRIILRDIADIRASRRGNRLPR